MVGNLKGNSFSLINSTNISLDYYTNMINSFLENCVFSSEYKSYDESKGDIITFICFNIESLLNKGSLVLKSFKYQGNLVFTYNKTTNEVWINELPKSCDEKSSISVFTSDIISIIVEKLKGYVDKDRLIIRFKDDFLKFAIDNNVSKVLPQIEDNINYRRMCFIYEQLRLEEERIRNEVLEEKRRKDKEDAMKERVIAEKSVIYGIDQRDYENYLDYLNAVNKRLCEVCDYKINNIKRHLEANKKIYIELLRKNDMSYIDAGGILECICGEFDFIEYCSPELLEQIEEYFEDESVEVELTDELLNIYYESIYQYDSNLSNEESLISLLIKIRKERGWDECRYDRDGKCPAKPDDMYNYILGVNDFFGTDCDEIINYDNPIFNGSKIVEEDFKKCVDVLFQIASLKEQLSYYEGIKSNPDKALLNFQSSSDSWNSILNFPYWLRLGRDTNRIEYRDNKEKFNLLMIKPGVQNIDLNNIRIFTRNNGQEFGSTKVERRAYLNKVMQGDSKCLYCDRLMITVPKSLSFECIIELIDYAHNYGQQLQFVCESPDTAVMIKEILIDRAISEYKQESIVDVGYYSPNYQKRRNKYFKDWCFICVDPNYYSNFMIDTPTNKTFWHRYDYTGSYEYRKREVASLDYLFDYAIYKNTHDGVVDYEQISKQLLGGYSSKEGEVEPINVRVVDFMDYPEFYSFPECKGMDYIELMDYVDRRYGKRFYLEDTMRNELYSSDFKGVNEDPNEEKVYKKVFRLEIDEDDELPFN